MFRHSGWMSTAAYWLGLVALFSLPFRADDWVSWIPFIIVTYFSASLTLSVGYHRLFCHNAFTTNKFWHYLFAITGTLFMYSSPLQWAVTHSTHHRKTDTELDPHPHPKYALLFKGYRSVPLDTWQIRRLIKRSGLFHMFVDKYYLLIYGTLLALISAISFDFVLYAYIPVLGLAHFVGGVHNLLSHSNKKPRDLAFMEFLFPASGEWLHGYHHSHWRAWNFAYKPHHFDMGSWVIRAIRK